MKKKTRSLTTAALLTALGTALLYVAAALPSGRLALGAVAGALTAVCLLQSNWRYALGVFAATGVLGLLLAPGKLPVLLYLAFFGYYPILKSPLEHLPWRWLEWVLKLAVCNLALLAARAAGAALVLPHHLVLPAWALPVVCSVLFVCYDLALSGLIRYYILHIAKHISR